MGKLLGLCGLVFLVLVLLSFARPAAEYAGAGNASAAAEAQLRAAEREADQAAREAELLPNEEGKAKLREAAVRVRELLGTARKAKDQQDAAWERLRAKLGRWLQILGD